MTTILNVKNPKAVEVTHIKDRVALITGATGLLGSAIAADLRKSGVKVILNYFHNDSKAQSFSETGEPYKADINDQNQFFRMMEDIRKRYGRLDILVNNFGPIIYKALMEIPSEDFQAVLLSNIMPVFNGSRFAGKIMMEQGGGGRIINIAAAGADEIRAKRKTTPYFIGKNAVVMLTKSFALEFAPYGITVNSVSPGIIAGAVNPEEGSMNGCFSEPMKERVSPGEVAAAVAFLCSDEARHITGENITVGAGTQLV